MFKYGAITLQPKDSSLCNAESDQKQLFTRRKRSIYKFIPIFFVLFSFLICYAITVSLSFTNIININNTTSAAEIKSTYLYITRHGEKIKDSLPSLSTMGVIRSNCLVNYFRNFPFGIPIIIYAELSRSQRAVMTATPLSIQLDIPIFSIRDELIHYIKRNIQNNKDGIILSIMEHNDIVILAQALGCTTCKSWNYDHTSNITNNSMYNTVWIFHFVNAELMSFYTTSYDINNTNNSKSICNNTSYVLRQMGYK